MLLNIKRGIFLEEATWLLHLTMYEKSPQTVEFVSADLILCDIPPVQ